MNNKLVSGALVVITIILAIFAFNLNSKLGDAERDIARLNGELNKAQQQAAMA